MTYGEWKICSAIKKSQNIINMIADTAVHLIILEKTKNNDLNTVMLNSDNSVVLRKLIDYVLQKTSEYNMPKHCRQFVECV